MRKVLGLVVFGAVVAGVMLWFLEPYKDRFPGDWEGIFDLAWAPMPLPRLVVAIAVLVIGYLLLEYSARGQGKKTQEAVKAKPVANGPAKLEPSFDTVSDHKMDRMSLTDDEETVLASLSRFANSVYANKLQHNTGLSERRFENAVGNLRSRFFIDDVPLAEGRSIAFKQDGRRYAIKHGLGQK